MVNQIRDTVDVDDRGRFTISEPARRYLQIDSENVSLELDVRVLLPRDASGNKATAEGETDDRGRITIRPPDVREDLGIKGREATVEVTVSKKFTK